MERGPNKERCKSFWGYLLPRGLLKHVHEGRLGVVLDLEHTLAVTQSRFHPLQSSKEGRDPDHHWKAKGPTHYMWVRSGWKELRQHLMESGFLVGVYSAAPDPVYVRQACTNLGLSFDDNERRMIMIHDRRDEKCLYEALGMPRYADMEHDGFPVPPPFGAVALDDQVLVWLPYSQCRVCEVDKFDRLKSGNFSGTGLNELGVIEWLDEQSDTMLQQLSATNKAFTERMTNGMFPTMDPGPHTAHQSPPACTLHPDNIP